jgi:hypothetical protein
MVRLLELTHRPKTLGFQADMAHTLLYALGVNAPEHALLPAGYDWSDPAVLDDALRTLTAALRPHTIDFHIAQNDATVKGSGSHDKTGRHCLANDRNGKLNIPHHAGFWLRDGRGRVTRNLRHICWDGCMFPNAVMMKPQTWNDILGAMIAVRDAHGWSDEAPAEPAPAERIEIRRAPARKGAAPMKPMVVPRRPAAKTPAQRKTSPALPLKPRVAKPAKQPVRPAPKAKRKVVARKRK